MTTFAKDVLVDFISLLYPTCCFSCNDNLVKGEEMICSRCMIELPRTNHHLEQENPLFKRLNGRIPLSFAFAFFLFRKGGKVQRILHSLKYNNLPELGERIGEVYGEELKQAGYAEIIDVIIPVPLHISRKRNRGYNQSEEFARGLSTSLAIPFLGDGLERVVKTETQTRKTKLKRWQNVSEVFKLKQHLDQIANKHILLVDDVITTGATIEACAQVLLENGCSKISVASIAYAQEGK